MRSKHEMLKGNVIYWPKYKSSKANEVFCEDGELIIIAEIVN